MAQAHRADRFSSGLERRVVVFLRALSQGMHRVLAWAACGGRRRNVPWPTRCSSNNHASIADDGDE
jgi:hypothetical protein